MANNNNNNNVAGIGSKHSVSEVYESSSKFESNKSTSFVSSSSSSAATALNGCGDTAAPKYKLDSFSVQSEKHSKQIGRNAPVQV